MYTGMVIQRRWRSEPSQNSNMAPLWTFLLLVAGAFAQNATTVIDVLNDWGETKFLDLIDAAGLTSMLKGTGPFTVFSPRDSYFGRMGTHGIAALKADHTALTKFVQYHIVRGKVLHKDLNVNEKKLTSLTGDMIRLNYYYYNRQLAAQGVDMTGIDHVADNGVVHLLHGIIHPANGSITDILASNPELSSLKMAVDTAGIANILSDGPYTLLAPNNDAFTDATVQKLKAHPAILKEVLLYHVIHGTMYSTGMHSTTLHNLEEKDQERISSLFSGRYLSVDGHRIQQKDISATNGVIHVLNRVLIPHSMSATIAAL